MEGQIWRRSEQLSQARTARMKEMQRQREEEAMRECTFKPRITVRARIRCRGEGSSGGRETASLLPTRQPMPDGKRPTSKFRIARDSTPRDDQQAKDGFAELHPFKPQVSRGTDWHDAGGELRAHLAPAPQLNATSQRLAASRQAVSPSSGVFRVADRRLQAEKREEIERVRAVPPVSRATLPHTHQIPVPHSSARRARSSWKRPSWLSARSGPAFHGDPPPPLGASKGSSTSRGQSRARRRMHHRQLRGPRRAQRCNDRAPFRDGASAGAETWPPRRNGTASPATPTWKWHSGSLTPRKAHSRGRHRCSEGATAGAATRTGLRAPTWPAGPSAPTAWSPR